MKSIAMIFIFLLPFSGVAIAQTDWNSSPYNYKNSPYNYDTEITKSSMQSIEKGIKILEAAKGISRET